MPPDTDNRARITCVMYERYSAARSTVAYYRLYYHHVNHLTTKRTVTWMMADPHRYLGRFSRQTAHSTQRRETKKNKKIKRNGEFLNCCTCNCRFGVGTTLHCNLSECVPCVRTFAIRIIQRITWQQNEMHIWFIQHTHRHTHRDTNTINKKNRTHENN